MAIGAILIECDWIWPTYIWSLWNLSSRIRTRLWVSSDSHRRRQMWCHVVAPPEKEKNIGKNGIIYTDDKLQLKYVFVYESALTYSAWCGSNGAIRYSGKPAMRSTLPCNLIRHWWKACRKTGHGQKLITQNLLSKAFAENHFISFTVHSEHSWQFGQAEARATWGGKYVETNCIQTSFKVNAQIVERRLHARIKIGGILMAIFKYSLQWMLADDAAHEQHQCAISQWTHNHFDWTHGYDNRRLAHAIFNSAWFLPIHSHFLSASNTNPHSRSHVDSLINVSLVFLIITKCFFFLRQVARSIRMPIRAAAR